MTEQRISLVTGAGAGVGAAVAAKFAEAGDHVVCVDLELDRARATAASLPHATAMALDVRDEHATDTLVARLVETFGGLDVVVPNAGAVHEGPAVDLPEEEYDAIMDVNVRGAFFTARAAGRAMIERGQGGTIVFVASTHAVRPMRLNAAYAGAKGAVRMMSTMLAREWARHQIRVNCVAPGLLDTDSSPNPSDPQMQAATLKRVPMRRLGVADEVAAAVRFLASPEASFVTGSLLAVDGGWLTA